MYNIIYHPKSERYWLIHDDVLPSYTNLGWQLYATIPKEHCEKYYVLLLHPLSRKYVTSTLWNTPKYIDKGYVIIGQPFVGKKYKSEILSIQYNLPF